MTLANGWTGGQYSVARFGLGVYLLVHFTMLLPFGAEMFSSQGVLPASASPLLHAFPNVFALSDAPWVVTLVLSSAAVGSVLLAIGQWDRLAAVWLWYVWACLFGRNPLISNPGLPYVGLLLVVHALNSNAPYGSLKARGQVGGWVAFRVPEPLFGALWVLMALGYSYSGYTKLVSPSWLDGTAVTRVLQSPLARPGVLRDLVLSVPEAGRAALSWGALGLELSFAPLALSRKIRPLLWLGLAMMHAGLVTLIDFADLSLGMLALHAFTFDPAWVRGQHGAVPAWVFVRGAEPWAHHVVRFLVSEDPGGRGFRFGPVGGAAFQARVPSGAPGDGEGLVLVTGDGVVRSGGRALFQALAQLGGAWRLLELAARWVPARVADAAVDRLGRGKVGRDASTFAELPEVVRSRFDLR